MLTSFPLTGGEPRCPNASSEAGPSTGSHGLLLVSRLTFPRAAIVRSWAFLAAASTNRILLARCRSRTPGCQDPGGVINTSPAVPLPPSLWADSEMRTGRFFTGRVSIVGILGCTRTRHYGRV